MTVCDLCRYNPPSSADGKPCTMCPAETRDTTIKTLEQNQQAEEWYKVFVEKFESCEDAISREDTLTAFSDYVGGGMSMNDFDALWDIVTKMPSVAPVERTGYWIKTIDAVNEYGSKTYHYECSECESNESGWGKYRYCPNCGTKMVNPQESEDKE